ncbi:hypothetical protein [Fimbriiglobus ruber]|uniref:Uncharacterized protein n=1 Tax=Fimbriiglobus ruber TaxID=1908690 RepID=A0A225DQW7_9BACT|nr:hypothetical protein [Fimbriiglobus ruber]OWK43870.1 hypothetical protein FRUB_03469 [Fimbriiglobus ruber]
MEHQEAVLIALGITVVLSTSVVVFLFEALSGVLEDYCGNPALARFWTTWASALLVLVPATVTLLTVPLYSQAYTSSQVLGWLDVLGFVKWGALALIGTMVAVAGGVGLFGRGGSVPVWIDRDQSDDLNRLLTKVQELRAHEVIDRVRRR